MNDPQEHNRQGAGLSRRQFLQGSGAAAAAALGAPALPLTEAAQPPAAGVVGQGPGPVKISLTVNGRRMHTSVEPRVTLLDALRNHLDVTGCKRVCDRGTCGACTVLVGNADKEPGKPIYACCMLALEARDKFIRTAESLGAETKLDAVPAAFVRFDAQQCGFCTPGFVVAMRAVLNANPKATPAEVEHGLAGNICRCGTYEQMRDAIYALCNQKRRE